MKKLDYFDDKEFQSFDAATKKKITTNYFNSEIADKEFLSLDKSEQDRIRNNFSNAQIDDITPQELAKKQKRLDKIDEYIPDFAEDFVHGAAKNVTDYTASAAKLFGADELQHKARLASKTLDKNIDNKYVGMAGEMLGDPLNLTPAGIVSKGTKAVRVAKSVAGGAAIGAGTMLAKDYGNDEKTKVQTANDMVFGAEIAATLNGIIAGVTKGKVTNAVNADMFAKKGSNEVANGIMTNPKAFGLSEDEAAKVIAEAKKAHPKVPDKFKVEQAGSQPKPQEPNFRQVPQHPPAAITPKEPTGLDQIDEGFTALNKEIAGDGEELTPKGYVEPQKEVPQEEPKKELPLEQQLQNAQIAAKENLRIAEFRNSIDKPDEAKVFEDEAKRHTQEATRLEEEIQKKNDLEHKANVDEMLKNPRLEELLKMREDVLAKDAQSPQNLVNKRDIQHTNSGDGFETKVTPAQYEKNHNYDFELTKQDVKNIRDGKIDSNTAAKLETDLGTLDNHPDYAPAQEPNSITEPKEMSDEDWKTANEIFAKGADNAVVATYAGFNEDENGNITFDPAKFVLGLGGYAAVKAALRNGKVQGVLKDYAQKAIDKVDFNPEVQKANGFNSMSPVKSKVQKEKRGIYNVTFNGKNSSEVRKADSDELIRYAKGNKNQGAIHIQKHLGDGSVGEVSKEELLNIGDIIRNGSLSKNHGKNVYYLKKDGIKYRVITGSSKNDNEKVITFYSNRNLEEQKGYDISLITNNSSSDKTIIPQEAEKIKKDKNFKKWFKGSKVVDDKGKPIVVYHGTNTTFDEFKKDFIGRNFDDYSIGFSFSSDAKTAEKYAKNFGEQTKDAQNIMPVYLDIKNPLIIRGEHATMTTDLNRHQIKREIVASRKTDTPYDGIITIGNDGEKHYMVFEPTQIKSINNKGTFDGTNPNILHANAGHTLAGAFAGGADSELNQRDYNGDGKHDYKDLLLGVATGAISVNALKKMAPKLFEEEAGKDGIKLGAFDGDKPFKETLDNAKAKGYEHVRKIVSDESLKEWGNAANWFRRTWTDTLSADYHNIRESATSSTSGESVKLERLHNALKELDEIDRTDLHNFIAGENNNLNESLKPLALHIKKDINDLSQSLVDRGVLSQEAHDEWAGYYIHRSYDKHFLQDIKGLMKKGFKIDEIHARGKIETLTPNQAKKFKQETPKALFSEKLKDGGVRLKQLPNKKWELRRDWTQLERQKMNEITDGSITIPETLMRLKRMSDNAKFLEDVKGLDEVVLKDAENFTPEEIENAGYIKTSKSAKYGVLADKVIRKDVYNDINAINNEIFNTFGNDGAMARVWKNYLTTWKKSKTVWNIPSHVNNFMSNMFLMHLAGMNTAQITTAVGRAGKMMIHGNAYEELLQKKMLGRATKKDLENLAIMGEDLKYFIEAKESGLLGKSQLNDILAGQQDQIQKRGVLGKLDKFAQDAYHNGDTINRIAMYAHLRDKLEMGADEARKAVLAVMPDYSKPMPQGYKVLRDTGISPFISWTYYTMPAIFKMLRTKQGATKALMAMGTLASLQLVLTEGEVSPLDDVPFIDTKKPGDFKGRRFAVSSNDGKITTIKTDRWIPYVELLNPINFAVSQASGPSVKATVNFATSLSNNGMVDTYTGRPVTYASRKFSKKTYDYFKYLTQSYVPLPAQAYTGWNTAESLLRDKKDRRTNDTVVPRTVSEELLKNVGLNSLTYSKKGLKKEQRK